MNDFQKFLDEKLESIQLDNGIINGDIADSYDIYQEIRDAITALRHDNHMTQKELAERTGIRPPTISAMANNTAKHYPVDVMDKICGVLNCGVGDLLEYISDNE